MRALLLGLAACAGLNALFPAPVPPPGSLGIRLEEDSAVETASLFGLGMRRLAADLGLIRMLVYYGTPEPGVEAEEAEQGGGHYPALGPKAMRILDVDPAFSYAAFFASGALAFNLNRPQEALDVLQYGLRRDPKNTKYHLYIAAVGFQRHGDFDSVILALEPILRTPDCPTMIKSMAAFLYKRKGLKEKAIRLYRDILENSRDEGYRSIAERMLKEMKAL